MNLRRVIEATISSFGRKYNKYKKRYLTEADVVSDLFSMLDQRLKQDPNLAVHSQLRPFSGENRVIRGKVWKQVSWISQQKDPRRGSLVDIAVIDMSEAYWKRALNKAKRFDYWRILSYPVEAFRAALEVKIRVKGNFDTIKRDIVKLVKIRNKSPDCLSYLIVSDRKSVREDRERIKKFGREQGIRCFIFGARKKGSSRGISPR